jgi:TatD DNase family protein
LSDSPLVYGAFGIHPHYAKSYTRQLEDQLVKQAMSNPKCVAWGEIGLDYHYTHSPVEVQKEVFARQLQVGWSENGLNDC